MDDMWKIIQEDVAKALGEQDFGAIGRLHQTLHQFLELSKMYTVVTL
jgi:hypothetical protein